MTAPDLLTSSLPLEHQLSLPVLGIDTRFESNSPEVIDLVKRSFDRWRELSDTARTEQLSVRIRIAVIDGDEHSEPTTHSPISYVSGPDKRLHLHSNAGTADVDPLRRESIAHVTSALVHDRDYFRVAVLEAITFALLACFDRHPLHAAAITRGDRTALLAGPSGSGKSTLAYLAHSEGIRVLSDDHVWIQLDPECRIWGSAPHARLRAESAAHFPDVDHPGGEKLAVALAPRGDDQSLVAGGPVVCILARGKYASLEPLQPSDIEAELVRQLSPGFDRFPERNHAVFSAIANGGGWRLTLSDDPYNALPLLHHVLDGS
jgi:hypothetical protein